MNDAALQAALNFTDDDLVANRAGRLSPQQQLRMTKTKGRSQFVNLVFGGVFVVTIIVIAVYVLPMYMSAPAGSSAPPVGVISAVTVVVIGIIGFTILRNRRKLNRLDGAVLVTEGEASGRQGMAPLGEAAVAPVYRLSIGRVTFRLGTPEPLTAFTNGAYYRAYYVQGTLPILVSAELLPVEAV